MSIQKKTRECYEVRSGTHRGEWANITLDCWQRAAASGSRREEPYYCGELVIHSSFGAWAYTWTACAVPFKQFLQDIEFDYTFGKLMGADLEEFDGEGSVRWLRQRLIEYRRRSSLYAADARAIWDALEDCHEEAASCSDSWVRCLSDVSSDLAAGGLPGAADFLSEPWDFIHTRPKRCAVGFWDAIWPEFVSALRSETEGVSA